MKFSSLQRSESIDQLQSEVFDLIVIGGGITGSGIALDAATRGMKVAVVEMQDFAAGTSSRSTKLVHGGLRYLKQFQVKMVAEVGKERAIVYENGPHVTTPEWMLLPMHKGGTFGKFSTGVGLRVYDFLAGVVKDERRKMLSAEETLNKEPLVKKDGLLGGGYYVEYRTDDARLTIEVLKKAVESGALAVNYVKAEEFLYNNKKITGVKAKDLTDGKMIEIHAKKVVNAAGPWVDAVRSKDYSINNKRLRLTKGVHIVIDQSKFPLHQAIYFDTPDGRMVFAIPRNGKAYVGTTDTFFDKDKDKANPKVLSEDRDYLLKAIQYMFPDVKVEEKDIESSWAGVRPLIFEEGKDPSEISRKDEMWEGDSGLVTIAGGKLTGYRKMAESVVNLINKRLSEETGILYMDSQTLTMPISGGDIGGAKNFTNFVEQKAKESIKYGFTEEQGRKLAQMYGTNVDLLFGLAENKANEGSLPLDLYVQLVYAIKYESALKPVDFFIRRTGALFFDISIVKQHKGEVIRLMTSMFKWDEDTVAAYTKDLEKELTDAVTPPEMQE